MLTGKKLTADAAATLIQKQWKVSIKEMKSCVIDSIKIITEVGGKNIVDKEELNEALDKGDIIIQINVADLKKPLSGHAAFFIGDPTYCYQLTTALKKDPEASASAKYPSASHNGSYAKIFGGRLGQWQHKKMEYLADKGVLYRLPGKYSLLLKKASEDEILTFSNKPYGYGYQYNCNIFIRNCFRRLVKFSELKHSDKETKAPSEKGKQNISVLPSLKRKKY